MTATCAGCGEPVTEDPDHGGFVHLDGAGDPDRNDRGHYAEPEYGTGDTHPDFCARCSGPWGADSSCANCTLPDGRVRPTIYHRPDCAGDPRCAGCGWFDQFGNWIPGPEGG